MIYQFVARQKMLGILRARERGGKHRMIVPYVRKRFSQTYGPMYLSLGRSYVAMHERLFRAI